MSSQPTQERPDHFILHISDTHFTDPSDRLFGAVNTAENLERLFEGFNEAGSRPEAIIFTGDLADEAVPAAYRRLREIVDPVAARLGAEVIWVMGNHDDRATLRVELLDEPGESSEYRRVHDINGLRVVVLDSTVPGRHHGEISDEQLEWLSGVLAVPAPHGTLLALHHPPVPSPLHLFSLVELRDQHRLADVIAGTDVRGILGGHLHYSTNSTFAGVPVSVAAATCFTQDLNARQPEARGQDGGQSYNFVHVYSDRVVNSIVPIGHFVTVYDWLVDELTELERAESSPISTEPSEGGGQ